MSIQRSIIEKFNFNGKVIRSVHVRDTGECLVASDVYRAIGYDDDNNGRRAVRTHVPDEYKMRVKDALTELSKQVDIDLLHPDTVLLKEPGLYCFLLRCDKPEAESFMQWVVEEVLPREVRKLATAIEEKQRAIDEKDMHIALLDDDLTESQDLVRQLEFSNTGMQGEIRAKDQEIHRRREEVQDLVANRHVPRRQGIDNVLCFVDKKSNDKHQFYVIRCQRKALETNKRCLRNRYPDMVILEECDDANAVHRWCRFKGETIEDFHRNHFNLDEEGRELFETAFDVAL